MPSANSVKRHYGATFKDCLHEYAIANHRLNVWIRRRFKHAIVGAIALGILIVTAPFYFYPNLTAAPTLYGALFLLSVNIVSWCGGFLLFTRKKFQSLKTKEFMAYATLDELCIIDYIRKDNE